MNAKTTACMLLLTGAFRTAAANTYPQTRVYLLGDIDGIHYDGLGSVDHVYCDPVLWDHADLGVGPATAFDVTGANQDVPFTFVLPLAPDEEVVAATVALSSAAADLPLGRGDKSGSTGFALPRQFCEELEDPWGAGHAAALAAWR